MRRRARRCRLVSSDSVTISAPLPELVSARLVVVVRVFTQPPSSNAMATPAKPTVSIRCTLAVVIGMAMLIGSVLLGGGLADRMQNNGALRRAALRHALGRTGAVLDVAS